MRAAGGTGGCGPGRAHRVLATAGLAAGASRLAWRGLRAAPPGGAARWARVNHRGEPLTLLEGPAYATAVAAALALAPGIPRPLRAAGTLAGLGAGVFGLVDDLAEAGSSKGLRGHLGELAHGRLTTGGLKVLGLGATGLLAASLAVPRRDGTSAAGRATDVLTGAALVAGCANLVNLFDLRPGRALKVTLLATPALAVATPGAALVAAATGAAAGLLNEDLAERAMLGDTGANAAGAVLGTALAAGAGRRGRMAALAVVAALTLASERVSFTAVIEATPALRALDLLGRRPQTR